MAFSLNPEIFRALFALVRDDVVRDLGAFAQVEASLLDRRDMDEHVPPAAAVRRDEPVTLGRIKPLYSPAWHVRLHFQSGGF
jgi:hypothetical protein